MRASDTAVKDAGQPLQGAEAARENMSVQEVPPLFSSLDAQTVSDVTIATPERTFRFAQSDGVVSVNGQKADAEIFMTLLTQIATLPVAERTAFLAQNDPFLTLTVDTNVDRLFVGFYRDDPEQAYADVICMEEGEPPRYGVTKAWRVGKLVLTCDGTRILDENGNEAPAP